jgi:polyisoprenoid-binding protein YceI
VPERSSVSVRARSNVHPIRLRAEGPEGHLDLAAAVPTGRLSLRVERLRGANPLEDAELRRLVDAARHPTIEGVLTTSREHAPGAYQLGGEVTFKGVSVAVAGDVALEPGDGGGAVLRGEADFDIRDFGLEPPRVLLLRVEPVVSVTIELHLAPAD